MKIVVIDGQGGRLGRLLIERVKARLPQAQVYALGTNSVAVFCVDYNKSRPAMQ